MKTSKAILAVNVIFVSSGYTANTLSFFRRNSHLLQSNHDDTEELSSCHIRDSFNLIILGDLHLEENNMAPFYEAQQDCLTILEQKSLLPCGNDQKQNVKEILASLETKQAKDLSVNELEMLLEQKKCETPKYLKSHLVSLGDLGRKTIRNEAGDPGTTKSFNDAKSFLDHFQLPYNLVTGNHDLEGMWEFDSDASNLKAWMDCFELNQPWFEQVIGDRTVLLGLSTTRFRDAPFSSHECHVEEEQLNWFKSAVEKYSAQDGWKIFVFSHAPIMGSGLRVLQNVHVTNGCAWLNHCSSNRNEFINIVKTNPQIKLWFSGHFHLSHDYQDSIYTVGSCTFVQVGVIGPISSRDERRQTRLIRGCTEQLQIYSINHHAIAHEKLRLDAVIDLHKDTIQVYQNANEIHHEDKNWFKAYIPAEEDGCYINLPDGPVVQTQEQSSASESICCWWHMSDGAVLGLHGGQLVEYDRETYAPLGIIVNQKQLKGREVLVIEEGTVLVLVDKDNNEDVEVVHPNEDGSYWRKYQRNKKIRQEEKAREAVAKLWLEKKK